MRARVLRAFEAAEREDDARERERCLRFVVIGGGPTGVELAGTLAEIARHTLPREFRRARPRNAEVHLIEAGPRILPSFPPKLSDSARRQLAMLGVNVHTGAPVTAIDATGATLGAKRIEARTVLWAAGVSASPLGAQLPGEKDRAGRVSVQPDLSVAGHPDVFVVGDLARTEPPVPGVAPAAKQMGAHAAQAILARIDGVAPKPFRYRDYGNLATIGRMAAVVHLGRLKLSGIFAWWFWLVAHLFFLIGFRNRLVVLINWAWSYFTYQRHARIIVGNRDTTGND
jgi:NADH dehydrogenase